MGRGNMTNKLSIYSIANLSTKVLSYAMLILYTYYIDPKNLGYYDVVVTTISLLTPVMSLKLQDAVYRWILDDKERGGSIIKTAFLYVMVFLAFSVLVYLVVLTQCKIRHGITIGFYAVFEVLFDFVVQTIRAYENNKLYVSICLFNSIVMIACEATGLIFLDMGIYALFLARILACINSLFIAVLGKKELRQAYKQKFDKQLGRAMLAYSWVFVPNSTCWWFVNVSDRYFIRIFLGAYYNGIYLVATKFPLVIKIIGDIFHLAWQDVSIKEYKNFKRDEIYSDLFKKYYRCLFGLGICAIPLTRLAIEYTSAPEYKTAWIYTGFLYLGAIYSSLSSFLGAGYIISKESSRTLITTGIAAVCNIVINFLLLQVLGLQAASFSTFAAYLVMFSIRTFDVKKYFILIYNKFELVIYTVLILIFMTATYICNFVMLIGLFALSLFIAIWINRRLLKEIMLKKVWE